MSEEYVPPKVWVWGQGQRRRLRRHEPPTAGAQREQELPVGEHPFQLYSLGTPNGQKVTIMLEELLEFGISEAEYDAWLIKIFEGDQFGSGFVGINPNSKIPAMVDRAAPSPFRLFNRARCCSTSRSSASSSASGAARAEVLSWLMWQVGSAPFMGGGFGHFYAYAPFKIEYAIDRYAMETKRLSTSPTTASRKPGSSAATRIRHRGHGGLSVARQHLPRRSIR
jgi:GST-like protein